MPKQNVRDFLSTIVFLRKSTVYSSHFQIFYSFLVQCLLQLNNTLFDLEIILLLAAMALFCVIVEIALRLQVVSHDLLKLGIVVRSVFEIMSGVGGVEYG
jgi:hypothetical protein